MSFVRKLTSWLQAKPRHVFDVLKHIEALCSVVGVSIYRYYGDPSNGVVKLSAAKFANFTLMNLLLSVVAVINAYIPYEIINNGSQIGTYVIRALLVGGAFGISAVTVVHAWHWKKLVNLLQTIHQLDLQFQLIKHPMNFTEQRSKLLQGTCCAVMVHVFSVFGFNVCTLLFIDNRFISWSMVFGELYFNLIYLTITCLFVSLTYVISLRFVHLNIVLKLHFDTSNTEEHETTSDTFNHFGFQAVQERVKIIQKMADMHHHLIKIADRVSRDYGDVLLINIFATMQFSAFNMFALMKIYASNDSRTMFTLFNLAGSLVYTSLFLFIVSRSHLIAQESKRTGTLLHKAMNNETNQELIRWMIIFSRQIRYRTAVLSSKQVIFGWPLIFETVVLLASYVVILLQFDAAIQAK